MAGFLKSLFGGGKSNGSSQAEAVEYNGFSIQPTPKSVNNGWSTEAVITRERILELRRLVRQVPVSRGVQDYAIRLVQATHPDQEGAPELSRRYVRYGSSPRGAQGLLLGAKILALLDGRYAASRDDIGLALKA